MQCNNGKHGSSDDAHNDDTCALLLTAIRNPVEEDELVSPIS